MTLDEWKAAAVRMEAWWPGTRWDEPMIAVWFEDMARFETEAVVSALNSLKRSHTAPFAPSIGAVLELLEVPGLGPPTLDEILAAVREVAKANDVPGSRKLKIADEVGWMLGAIAASFVEREGAERLLSSYFPPGSFERRDLQRELDELVGASERALPVLRRSQLRQSAGTLSEAAGV